MKYLNEINIKKRKLNLPVFFPDATQGVIRSIDSTDLKQAGIEGVIINTFHLMLQPGDEFLYKYGGIKQFMNWNGWVISDSGGFQIMSLIHKKKIIGEINSQGVIFKLNHLNGKKETINFTPEKSIQVQFNLGVDVMIALDYFTDPKADDFELKRSVDITIEWAKRAKKEYLRQLDKRQIKKSQRPLLLSVIQGGTNRKQRERCAKGLLKIGFDGYGFGGWLIDDHGNLDLEISRFNAQLTPDDKIRFALGVGTPQNIVDLSLMGYHLFDCVLPTRDARHGRLYVLVNDWQNKKTVFSYLFPLKKKYSEDKRPISEICNCYTCSNYSRSYLYHLFKIKDSLAFRLATIHNLNTYSNLIKILRKG